MAMKKKVIIAAIIISLLAGSLLGILSVEVAKANFIAYCPKYTIDIDGSISPPTELLAKNGDVYCLVANTSDCSFVIQRSNIVFNGKNHVIDGSVSGAGYSNVGLLLDKVANVTIKDITIQNFWSDNIALVDCSNCILQDTKSQGNQPIRLQESNYNTITQSNISDLEVMADSNNNSITENQIEVLHVQGSQNTVSKNNVTKYFFPYTGCNNLFYMNNFYDISPFNLNTNYWDNGSRGNYWSNYTTTDANKDGIGDTPYVIDANNRDNFPLISPINLESPNPLPTLDPTAAIPTATTLNPTLAPSPSPISSPTLQLTMQPSPSPSETEPWVLPLIETEHIEAVRLRNTAIALAAVVCSFSNAVALL
jgi:hypothetical protein